MYYTFKRRKKNAILLKIGLITTFLNVEVVFMVPRFQQLMQSSLKPTRDIELDAIFHFDDCALMFRLFQWISYVLAFNLLSANRRNCQTMKSPNREIFDFLKRVKKKLFKLQSISIFFLVSFAKAARHWFVCTVFLVVVDKNLKIFIRLFNFLFCGCINERVTMVTRMESIDLTTEEEDQETSRNVPQNWNTQNRVQLEWRKIDSTNPSQMKSVMLHKELKGKGN